MGQKKGKMRLAEFVFRLVVLLAILCWAAGLAGLIVAFVKILGG